LRTRYTAARVLPDARTDLARGAVVVEDDRIAWVGHADAAPDADVEVDLGDAVITAGLVNGHTHVDLSHLRGAVPYSDDFARWLVGVKDGRARPGMAAAAREAVRAAIDRGTTSFGDIVAPASFDDVVAVFRETGARARLFVEAIGFRPEVADAVFERVWELAEMKALPPRVDTGLSPHAPYSVSRLLIARAVAVASGHARPLAVHVAETLEELAFLRHGIGPLRELLKSFGADDPEHEPYRSLPGFLAQFDSLDAPLLLVHGNYLRPRDVPRGAFIVYCPTAHHFFRHPEHAVLELIDEGVRVALGSDSAASGETIDVLSETQFLARARLDLEPRKVFQMATDWGARALDLDAGTLEAGRLADLAAFTPAAGHEVLGLVDACCVLTLVGGEVLHRADGENPDHPASPS